MEQARLQALSVQALHAAVQKDADGIGDAMRQILTESNVRDGLAFVLGMISVATAEIPKVGEPGRDPEMLAVPRVANVNLDDGHLTPRDIEDAPHGVRAYARLSAAWLNDDRDTARAVWLALVEDPADEDGQELARCMATALHSAAHTVRKHIADSN